MSDNQAVASAAPRYAELSVTTNFSFLRGASHPDEYVYQAAALHYEAVGIADWNTLAGVVRAHQAAKEAGVKCLIGARLVTRQGHHILCYPKNRSAYGRLTRLLTVGNRRAPKGECFLDLQDILTYGEDQLFLFMPPIGGSDRALEKTEAALCEPLSRLHDAFPTNIYLGLTRDFGPLWEQRFATIRSIGQRLGVPLVATNDVLYHAAERRPLQDVLHCIREGQTIDEAGRALEANAERHLKAPGEMARLFQWAPEALVRTTEIAERITFSLDELRYDYPKEVIGEAHDAQGALVQATWEGACDRYPDGVPAQVRKVIQYELDLIGELNYAAYFLTVYDLVRFARSRQILCQGRGSAANSVVCYCLGVTSVDPTKVDLLFERFVSAARNEPPDIDIDFEHERREEVIQYIYQKYGRHRAGLAATVVTYRTKSAVREVGKALGLSEDVITALNGAVWGWHAKGVEDEHIVELGLDPAEERLALCMTLARELMGFPRHLSQHTGGFVMTESPLVELVPIQNAAMDDRTIVEWDKDDLDALGMLKVDVLALGMLSCVARAFDLLASHYERPLTLASVPKEDPRVYDMLCRADSIGVFQVESRAQMTMLPRLKPRCFYDLVIEVAIVRPGPIQGDMVHPYLRRREGLERISFPSKELEDVLGKTLGVPLFQEQAMRIAIVAAGFEPAEADRLRRAMATFRKVGLIHTFGMRLIDGMVANGYERDFAERCFKQIEGFGEYGFPESHAASFALLVYISSWIKCHYPDIFLCALLNSQPMGFYAPAQLVRDAREHGVDVRPVDINASEWDCLLERDGDGEPTAEQGNQCAVRLGFRQIKGLSQPLVEALLSARPVKGFDSLWQVAAKSGLGVPVLERLARADVFASLGLDRRAALWAIRAMGETPLPLFADYDQTADEPAVVLKEMPLGEEVVHDYATLRLSLKAHPVSFLRQQLEITGFKTAASLSTVQENTPLWHAGLVLVRQRPGSAKGVIFATLEDETGVANIIVWPKIFERYRRIVLGARLLGVKGRVQREGRVVHLVADHLEDMSDDLRVLSDGGQEIEGALARADEVKNPNEDPRLGSVNRKVLRSERLTRILPRSRDFH